METKYTESLDYTQKRSFTTQWRCIMIWLKHIEKSDSYKRLSNSKNRNRTKTKNIFKNNNQLQIHKIPLLIINRKRKNKIHHLNINNSQLNHRKNQFKINKNSQNLNINNSKLSRNRSHLELNKKCKIKMNKHLKGK